MSRFIVAYLRSLSVAERMPVLCYGTPRHSRCEPGYGRLWSRLGLVSRQLHQEADRSGHLPIDGIGVAGPITVSCASDQFRVQQLAQAYFQKA